MRIVLYPGFILLALIFIITLLILVPIQLSLAHGFIITFEAPLYFFLLVLCAIFYWGASAADRKRGWKTKRIFIAAFIAILLSLPVSRNSQKYLSGITKSDAKELSDAMEKFAADKKAYPGRLDELVPYYISELPKNWLILVPRNFHYARHNDGIELKYASYGGFICEYFTESKRWTCYD